MGVAFTPRRLQIIKLDSVGYKCLHTIGIGYILSRAQLMKGTAAHLHAEKGGGLHRFATTSLHRSITLWGKLVSTYYFGAFTEEDLPEEPSRRVQDVVPYLR